MGPENMKAVILAGGLGTRISEESHMKPKPMIEIGGRPILWHIMKIYSSHGINDFIICCGYRGYLIKEYFANYFLHMSDVASPSSTRCLFSIPVRDKIHSLVVSTIFSKSIFVINDRFVPFFTPNLQRWTLLQIRSLVEDVDNFFDFLLVKLC